MCSHIYIQLNALQQGSWFTNLDRAFMERRLSVWTLERWRLRGNLQPGVFVHWNQQQLTATLLCHEKTMKILNETTLNLVFWNTSEIWLNYRLFCWFQYNFCLTCKWCHLFSLTEKKYSYFYPSSMKLKPNVYESV